MDVDPRAAPLRRRLLAFVSDATMLLGPCVIGVAVFAWRHRHDDDEGSESLSRLGGPRIARTLQAGQILITIAARNLPSPGSRIAGIRRVDARTGGPVTLRSALVRQLLEFAVHRTIDRLNGPHRRRMEQREEQLRPRVEALRRELADDPAAGTAIGQLYRDEGISCLPMMARATLISLVQPLTALLSSRRQTLTERVAGIAVVRTG